ncbi:hypothetical protein [uncultured Roseovarius sp.]|uniref:thermonuclease family protein n=1 Tax=uncultured Roseovarius sp. TaxID=293344 RepID=UPI00263641CF|nr:hypothetical protein [uncultured Roseovarius sp.]
MKRRSSFIVPKKWMAIVATVVIAFWFVKLSGEFFGNFRVSEQSVARQISAHPNLSRVVDADTIIVGQITVRLDGISAPERGHEAYEAGKWFVADLMREAELVVCDLEGRNLRGREIGACYFVFPDGLRIDPQAEAVKAGFARDCPRYSSGRYKKFETSASKALPLPPYCT